MALPGRAHRAGKLAWLAAQARRSLSDCGKPRLPIFVTGQQNPTGVSTQAASWHDLEALGRWPAWFLLNYESPKLGDPRWYAIDPDCDGVALNVTDCDEFPFKSTARGGQFGVARTGRKPDLNVISASANRAEGAYLNVFYGACRMSSGVPQPTGNAIGGDPFLVIPIPVGMTSTYLCNGKK